MHQYTYLAVTFGVLLIILTSSTTTSASAIPLIVCQPNAMSDAPAKVRQLCYALFEKVVDTPQEEGELIEAAPLFDGKHLDGRGVKRQDVDHVFLRFGRRPSGL